MCLEDVTIDRAIRTRVYFAENAADIPANANRLAIRLTVSGNGSATLTAIQVPIYDGSGARDVLIGFTTGLASGTLDSYPNKILPDDITLRKIGDVLKGPLRLNSPEGATVFAIETYLDVDTPMSNVVTTLGKGK